MSDLSIDDIASNAAMSRFHFTAFEVGDIGGDCMQLTDKGVACTTKPIDAGPVADDL